MKRHWVKSSAIRSVGYDSATRVLEVRFIDGDLYRYFGVPTSVAHQLDRSESKGKYINEVIKPHFPMKRL